MLLAAAAGCCWLLLLPMYVSLCMCLYVCLCLYVYMYVSKCACMYVCLYVCMYLLPKWHKFASKRLSARIWPNPGASQEQPRSSPEAARSSQAAQEQPSSRILVQNVETSNSWVPSIYILYKDPSQQQPAPEAAKQPRSKPRSKPGAAQKQPRSSQEQPRSKPQAAKQPRSSPAAESLYKM